MCECVGHALCATVTHECYTRQRNDFYALDVVDKLEETTMTDVEAYMTKKIAAGKNNGCTLENAGVRREWYLITPMILPFYS